MNIEKKANEFKFNYTKKQWISGLAFSFALLVLLLIALFKGLSAIGLKLYIWGITTVNVLDILTLLLAVFVLVAILFTNLTVIKKIIISFCIVLISSVYTLYSLFSGYEHDYYFYTSPDGVHVVVEEASWLSCPRDYFYIKRGIFLKDTGVRIATGRGDFLFQSGNVQLTWETDTLIVTYKSGGNDIIEEIPLK